jgi:hypothetical protein
MPDAEPYELKVENRRSYVFAVVKGTMRPPRGSLSYLDAIAEHCIRYSCTAILIEKKTPEPFAVWDTFAVAPKLAKIGAACIKMAIVEKGAQPPKQKDLSIMAGRHCSLDVQIFSQISDAERWILDGATATEGRHLDNQVPNNE